MLYPHWRSKHSEIRQVPDTQEVHLDTQGYTSVMFDILERVEGQGNDFSVLRYHLSDIVGEDDDGAEEVRIVDEGREVMLGKKIGWVSLFPLVLMEVRGMGVEEVYVADWGLEMRKLIP